MKVAYQGIKGAYSETAATEYVRADEYVGYETVEEVLKALDEGNVDYAFLPVNNSTVGEVKSVKKGLENFCFQKAGEYAFRVRHQLWGVQGSKLSDVKCAYSHEQALRQSAVFLERNNICPIEYADTALACKYVAELNDKTVSAVASIMAGEIYNLKLLAQNIETNNDNTTMFWLIKKP